MRIALVQFDATVGDVTGNAGRIAERAVDALRAGADLAVFPELSLCGYPPRDLLQREGFAAGCRSAAEGIAAALANAGLGDRAVLVGLPREVDGRPRPLANAVALLRGGCIEAWYEKRLLPDYDVFDEERHFSAGHGPMVFACAGRRVGVLLCEDLWRARDVAIAGVSYPVDPVADAGRAGADVLVVPSASPFVRGKHARHAAIVASAAARAGMPVCALNASGANDDLVFDGDARIVQPDGRAACAARWGSGVLVASLDGTGAGWSGTAPAHDDMRETFDALVEAIRGYFAKSGATKAVLGLSGGIDSALVGALAAAALGGGNVLGILMPSKWSSAGSVDDANDLARRCGLCTMVLPIEPAHAALAGHLDAAFRAAGHAPFAGLADENLQSRLRGLQVMAVSNALGGFVLSTGNKSEMAVGYATLYGDMCGALAPLGDVLKTDVWALARWMNANHASIGFVQPPIPEASITKVPSAELRPDQTDQDTLPPYEVLDRIVRGWVEDELDAETIARAQGLDAALVARWVRAIELAEYKRRQAPIIPKLSARAFGPGRRMPVAARLRLP